MPRKRVDKEKRTVYSNRVVGVHRSLLDCLERRKHAEG